MIDPAWIFALVLAGAGAGWWLYALIRWAWRNRPQHRMFGRIPPSRWPRVDTETRRQLHKWDVR